MMSIFSPEQLTRDIAHPLAIRADAGALGVEARAPSTGPRSSRRWPASRACDDVHGPLGDLRHLGTNNLRTRLGWVRDSSIRGSRAQVTPTTSSATVHRARGTPPAPARGPDGALGPLASVPSHQHHGTTLVLSAVLLHHRRRYRPSGRRTPRYPSFSASRNRCSMTWRAWWPRRRDPSGVSSHSLMTFAVLISLRAIT